MLTVIATIRSKKGAEDKVRRQLIGLVPPTRKEDGCIEYVLYQDQSDTSTLMVYENWESKAHLDAHMQTAHFKECFAVIEGMYELKVQLLSDVSHGGD